MNWVPTSLIKGLVRGCTNLVSYSWRTSLETTAESFICWEKFVQRNVNCRERSIARKTVVRTVVLGRGSEIEMGRKSQ